MKRKFKQPSIFWKLSKSPVRLYEVIVPRTIHWIIGSFQLSLIAGACEYNKLSISISEIFKSRGEEEGLAWVKDARLCVMKFLEGNPITTKRVSLDSHGLPRRLGPVIQRALLQGSSGDIRMVMTVLNATRALSLGGDADLTTITKPRISGAEEYSALVTDMAKFVLPYWTANGYQWSSKEGMLPRALRWTSYHFTTKTGPNGHALWTSLLDLSQLSKSPDLLKAIQIVGGPALTTALALVCRWLGVINQLFPDWFTSKVVSKRGTVEIRKISSFPDKEAKVRVIAIGDYFSQTVLKPLHHYLFKFLKAIPQDHTHDQGGFLKTGLLLQPGNYCSADLSAATDRFPIEVIAMVLKGRLPSGWVDAWQTIMVGSPFRAPNGMSISYAVGNPMGFYSSWASFAVAHHFVIYYVCRKLGKPWRKARYALLGDDIVIKDDAIAKMYIEVMRILGVEVSELKTHSSPHFFEFAKRLFYKDIEVSPFPISALQEIHNKSYLIVALLVELEGKGWNPRIGIPEAVGAFATGVLHRKSANAAKWCEASWSVERIIKVMRGAISGGQFFNELAMRSGFRSISGRFTDSIAEAMLSNVAVELFSTSNPSSDSWQKKSTVPLGELATSWVMTLTGLVESPNLELAGACCDLIYAIPQIRGYGTIEETYLNLLAQARRIDTVEQGNWPKILRTMALPLDDRIFCQRTSHMISKGAALVAKQLIPRLEMIQMYPSLLDV